MSGTEHWILASGSPRRRELLSRLLPEFDVISPDIAEWEPEQADPVHQVEENALAKGLAVAQAFRSSRVIAADTTVALGRRLFAKPANRDEAVAMLRALSGKRHQVVTGIALLHLGTKHCFHDISEVVFKQIGMDDIHRYIDMVDVYDKAGAYAIQEHGEIIIDHYEGSFENIMGLPIQRLQKEWVQLGWMPASPSDV